LIKVEILEYRGEDANLLLQILSLFETRMQKLIIPLKLLPMLDGTQYAHSIKPSDAQNFDAVINDVITERKLDDIMFVRSAVWDFKMDGKIENISRANEFFSDECLRKHNLKYEFVELSKFIKPFSEYIKLRCFQIGVVHREGLSERQLSEFRNKLLKPLSGFIALVKKLVDTHGSYAVIHLVMNSSSELGVYGLDVNTYIDSILINRYAVTFIGGDLDKCTKFLKAYLLAIDFVKRHKDELIAGRYYSDINNAFYKDDKILIALRDEKVRDKFKAMKSCRKFIEFTD
jgi:hypothetical protein